MPRFKPEGGKMMNLVADLSGWLPGQLLDPFLLFFSAMIGAYTKSWKRLVATWIFALVYAAFYFREYWASTGTIHVVGTISVCICVFIVSYITAFFFWIFSERGEAKAEVGHGDEAK
jgi:hypothetical protein